MASTQGMKKKKENLASVITAILEEATMTRKGFTPEVVSQFYEAGSKARESRRQEMPHEESMREVRPSRQMGKIVARKADAERRAMANPMMTERAIESAVDLGERFELASRGRKLELREWVAG
jgi:hypothetical protein